MKDEATESANYPVTKFDSWADFKCKMLPQLFERGTVVRGKYVFRGQRDTTWPLASSFDRSFPDSTGKDRIELEKSLIQQFKIECEADPELRDLTTEEASLLALAQHHGVPTRLLDWTESPYVAAFFAFQHAISAFHRTVGAVGLDKHVAVWALDTSHYIWEGEHGVQIVSPPAWHNDRLRLQSGKFTRSKTPFKSLEEYVRAFGTAERASAALQLFSIPASEALTAIADLDLMGITHGSLFPGGDGRAQAAVSKVVLRNLSRKKS